MTMLKIPTWPRERDLATYEKYTTINFSKILSDDKVWIDVGCRTGIALSESRRVCQAHLVGVNAHDIEVLPGILALYAEIPQNLSVYKQYYKKADIVTDIYGAFSYDKDPVAVLLHHALLLKSGGVVAIVSVQAKLGNKKNIADIASFFETILGQKCSFCIFRTYTNTHKTPINSVRITICGECQANDSYESLLAKAREYIGEPKQKKIVYRPQDHSTEIRKTIYEKNTCSNLPVRD